MSADLVQDLKVAYNNLRPGEIETHLQELYSEDILFIDPANRIQGRESMFSHFESLYENLASCSFEYHESDSIKNPDSALLVWTMSFSHKRLSGGKTIEVDGSTLIRFNDQIYYHRDWFDLGELLYENLPVLGSLIKTIKSRLQ